MLYKTLFNNSRWTFFSSFLGEQIVREPFSGWSSSFCFSHDLYIPGAFRAKDKRTSGDWNSRSEANCSIVYSFGFISHKKTERDS